MEVGISTMMWGGLAVLLILGTLGPAFALWIILCFLSCLAGVIVMLFHHGRLKSDAWLRTSRSMQMPSPVTGIPKLVQEVKKGRPKFKADRHMTGSSTIDEVLHEILEYMYRDYIHIWYRRISEEEEFKHHIRVLLQRVIIALSERAKQVEFGPYLTTRLVDDFASHIRLYRRALNKVKEHQQDESKPPTDLETEFFDLETEMENNMCRDQVCMSEEHEKQYLRDLTEVLMFLLLPPEDFHNKPFRYITREVLVNGIFLPSLNMVSDPDYINSTASWLCKDAMFTHESFLTILKTTDSCDELTAVKEKVHLDIAIQRSRDTGGDNDTNIKQQLSSLQYVKTLCETRIQRLYDGVDDTEFALPGGMDVSKLSGQKLYSLPLDVVLNNNIALSYFIEFMVTIGSQSYLFFYLNVEGYRVSAEQQISAVFENPTEKADLEMLREAANSIYTQYLSEKASPQLHLDERLVANLWEKIQNDSPSEVVFDEIQARVLDLLQDDPQFFPAFKQSQLYIKLLAELDLLKDSVQGQDCLGADDDDMSEASSDLRESTENLASSCDSLSSTEPAATPTCSSQSQHQQGYMLSANIGNTGLCREHGKAYAVYMINVHRQESDGTQRSWDIYRRYSDFHDLHVTIQDRYDSLSGLALPSKKTFNNMHKDFLEKRRIGLNAYLQTLLNPSVLHSHHGLLELVYQFLQHVVWEGERSQLVRKVNTVVNPLKNSVKNMGNFVKSMPDNFADGVAKMSGGIRSIPNNMLDGFGKMLNVKGGSVAGPLGSRALKGDMLDTGKVGASLDTDRDEDNIPLRIMLLMMDEVFDLKSRNQWLRRRIVAILRQIVKTMFGDSINRRIVEQVEFMTTADQVAEYLRRFRDAFWPGGTQAEPRPPRDHNTKMRTRVVCKTKMLATISDEVRHLLGSETTRLGVMRIFNMFQHERLNKRLAYVILEGMLETLFPENKFEDVFRKIHSRSPRVKKNAAAAASTGSDRGSETRRRKK